MTDPVDTTADASDIPTDTTTVASGDSVDALMWVLTNLIGSAATPEIQQAQALLLQRLALEGSVIPSRISAPANITEAAGYINLLTDLGQNDMRLQMLGAALGLAGSVPLPGLNPTAPPLTLTPIANDQPVGATWLTTTVVMRSDLAAGLAAALHTVHAAGGLLPLWSPPALPAAGAPMLQDTLLYLGRAMLAAPTATTVDPQTDAVVLGRAASDSGTGFRLAIRVSSGTPDASTEDWTCLMWDDVGSAFTEQVVTGATLLPIETVLTGSGLSAVRPITVPSGRGDLSWARLAALGGLLPGVTRLGDELALVYTDRQIAASAIATMVNWIWDGTSFTPPT
jgi:hypothetical protein